VAAVTIFLYGKCPFAFVMTRAARLCRLHLCHRDSLIFRRGEIEFDVTIAALVHARVQFVAEFDVTRIRHLEIDIFEGMTLNAFFGLKCLFAVMTGAAGFPFFHLRHSDRLSCSHIVYRGVADAAIVRSDMPLVTEGYGSRLLYFHGYIGNFVTFDAILEIKGPLTVVAGAAGFALLHINHGVVIFFPEVVNCIMAGFAVILNALLLEMLVMVEYDLAEIGYFKGDIFYIDRICERAR
jgi:hypothetical protein